VRLGRNRRQRRSSPLPRVARAVWLGGERGNRGPGRRRPERRV